MNCLRALLVMAVLMICADAHGAMVHPRSRNSVDFDQINCDANTDHCSATAKGDGCV